MRVTELQPGSSLSQDDDKRPIMPACHIVNYSSLTGLSRLTTALEINRADLESHLNQEGRLGVRLCHYAQLYHAGIWEMFCCKAAP